MNTRILAAVVAATAFVSASAFADARYDNSIGDTQQLAGQSDVSRAEVRSEIAQARADGQLNQVETGTPLTAQIQDNKAAPASGITRADVRAQLNDRNLVDPDNHS
ncbi:DUF4148 domain-containing protein [Pandoraea norimbergensis]|uniref:DUF4148 domain-containing protein n=1 Tax=Pandoraea norimbergensis TaxID=93219 RepID=A0ABM6YCA2_9BURK|nr:DUF4148 domain-containing protein [Pandoraea norimbergensis]ALS59794.1 hypothetical protein AT302_08545 [Pandoraea norimbergensis]